MSEQSIALPVGPVMNAAVANIIGLCLRQMLYPGFPNQPFWQLLDPREPAREFLFWQDGSDKTLWAYDDDESAAVPEQEAWEKLSPDFSDSPLDAAYLIERCRAVWQEDTDPEPFFWQFTDCAKQGWKAEVMWDHHDGAFPFGSAVGHTLPEAACRALLDATESHAGSVCSRFAGRTQGTPAKARAGR